MVKTKAKKVQLAGSANQAVATQDEASLQDWLNRMRTAGPEDVFIRQRFPSDIWRDEYLATVDTRSEEEVLFLISSFLIEGGATLRSEWTYEGLMSAKSEHPDYYRKAMTDPFTRRLVRYMHDPLAGHPPPWEGNTWIAQLLPRHPDLALQGLEAYIRAYIGHFSDNQIWGHDDVEKLIRAKFIGIPKSYPDAIKLLHDLGWRKLECLVERLYYAMGYDTELTPQSRDGGRDVIARKTRVGEKEDVLIDTKLYTGTIEVDEARKMLGTLSDARATKGVIVTTSEFTSGAYNFAKNNPIELVDGNHLIPLMNRFLGSKWPLEVDHLVREALTAGAHMHL